VFAESQDTPGSGGACAGEAPEGTSVAGMTDPPSDDTSVDPNADVAVDPDTDVSGDADAAASVDLDAIERDLAAVEAALDRLSDGTYWTDEATGEPLPEELLAADPTARRVAPS
jgi:RNA polymerase-binding transcription factor DksA